MNRAGVLLVCAAALAAACAPDGVAPPRGERRAVAPRRGGVLHLASGIDLRSLDAAIAFDETSKPVEQLVYDTLVDWDAQGELQPLLARTVRRSGDGKRWDLALREGVLFHDGEELTADDVKRSLERTLHHDTPCPAPSFYASIVGYEAFHAGAVGASGERAYAPHLEGVVIDGRYALHVDLVEPDATFLAVLAMPFAAPLCRSAGATWTRDFVPCGAGPMRLSAWQPGREVRLARHAGYFQPGVGMLDEVVLTLGMPATTQRFAFEAGALDIVRELTAPDLAAYLRDPRWAPYATWEPPKGTNGVFLNTEVAPFDRVEVRRAVAAAIDWDAVVSLRPKQMVHATQMVPPAVVGHDPSFAGQRHDLAAALEHMRAAGLAYDAARGEGGWPEPIRYVTIAESSEPLVAQIVAQQLAAIGIRLDLRILSWPTFLAEVGKRGHAAMGYAGWSLDYPDASDFFEPLFASQAIQDEESQNQAFFASPELDGLLARAHRELSAPARAAMYRRAEEIVRDEAPWALGYGYRSLDLAQPRVHGFTVDRVHALDVRRVWLDEGARDAARGARRLPPPARLRAWGRP